MTGLLPGSVAREQALAVVSTVLLSPVGMIVFGALVTARGTGQLAAVPRSLVIVQHRRHARLVLGAGSLAPVAVLIAALPILLGVDNALTVLVITAGYLIVVCLLLTAAQLKARRCGGVEALDGASRGRAATADGEESPDGSVDRSAEKQRDELVKIATDPRRIELTWAVSWPRGLGHSRRLWVPLEVALARTGRPVVAIAATRALAHAYARRAGGASVVGRTVVWEPAPAGQQAAASSSHELKAPARE